MTKRLVIANEDGVDCLEFHISRGELMLSVAGSPSVKVEDILKGLPRALYTESREVMSLDEHDSTRINLLCEHLK